MFTYDCKPSSDISTANLNATTFVHACTTLVIVYVHTQLGMHAIHSTEAHSTDSLYFTSSGAKMPKLTWTTEMERVLLPSMVADYLLLD